MDSIPRWRSIYVNPHAYDSGIATQYLPYEMYGKNITLHIAVDESGMSQSMRSLNYTEYFTVDDRQSSYRSSFVNFEHTDDLSSYMFQKLVMN